MYYKKSKKPNYYTDMAKILGLDLGTNSIGWAVVNAEIENGKVKEYNGIDDSGVRIFPEGVVEKGTSKEISKNATRTEKRQTRRQFYRKRRRKIKLLQVLIDQNMCPLTHEELDVWKKWDSVKKVEGRKFPSTEKFKAWLSLNPYELRAKGVKEELSLEEFGRVLYHLVQRRGFLSGRKVKEDGTIFSKGKPDENILPIYATQEKIKDSTLGAYLYSILPQENKPYTTIKDENGVEIRVRGRYTVRDMYVWEFEKIWQCQNKYRNFNEVLVNYSKSRKLRGNISSSKNQKKLEKLKQKYGEQNVHIKKDTLVSYEKIPLKDLLVGNIWFEDNENGEKTLKFKSSESSLFWQRPLRSQKQYLSDCRFENNMPVIKKNGQFLMNPKGEVQTNGKKPCPISHPDFELFRAYQFINNISYGKNNRLTQEQKELVLDLINANENNFDFSKIPQKLKLTYEKFNYDDKHKVPGNYTHKKVKPLFSKEIWEKHYNEIWHCFHFYDDSDMLLEKLKKNYDFSGSIEDVKKIVLKDDYSNVSLKAIRNILPYLEKGYMYDRAVILGGVKNAFASRWDRFLTIENFEQNLERDIIAILKEKNKEGEAINKIKKYVIENQYGFVENDPFFSRLYHHSHEIEAKEIQEKVPLLENLRNPIVQQALHETRRLVNTLIKKYSEQNGVTFRFDKIHIEMGRDLRQNKSQRLDATFRNNRNNAKNNEARERLAEYGLRPSRENIQKYLLYKEIEERAGTVQCPYTGKTISVSSLLGSNNAIQIEHIIPYSVSLDDGFANKTLCETHFNKLKSEKTPYQFYQENSDSKLWGASSWDEVKDRAFKILPYAKAKRFVSEKDFESNDFIERQLNDSRYIAKKAVELLSAVCEDVRAFPGQVTSELRHLWGVNNVLSPIKNLSKAHFDVDEERRVPYYVIVNNETNEILSIQRKLNEKPKTKPQEILLPVYINKGKIESQKYSFSNEVAHLEDGKYWAHVVVENTVSFIPKYISKPIVDENAIILKGLVEKGSFKNDTLKSSFKTVEKDGYYWGTFAVTNKSFELPQKDKQPAPKTNQIVLFGNVINGVFTCYIYSCKTDFPDGKCWIILDIDPNSIVYTRANNDEPQIHENQLLLTAVVDDTAKAIVDVDKDAVFETDKQPGKYYAVFTVKSVDDFSKIENALPTCNKGERVIEGDVWLDKYTGEIQFDPKKNREDHRHHAIDAIVIALTQQNFLQRLSTEHAKMKDKERGIMNTTEKFPLPWNSFVSDVKHIAEGMLVSYKQNTKILTKNKKGVSVRGALHKETVYGKRKAPQSQQRFHIRKKITGLSNEKDIAKIVDSSIVKLIENHLRDTCGVDISKSYTIPKDAFYKDGEWRLFLPNKNGEPVPIKKIRLKEVIGNAVQLKSELNQYVNPRNNHHVIIFKDEEGNLHEQVVQFWEVVERLRNNEKVYQLPVSEYGKSTPKEIVTTLQENDMFILGLSDEEFSDNRHNHAFLSRYLYRVQKISSGDYSFRFHLASSINNKQEEVRIASIKAWEKNNPIKAVITPLGKIEPIE